MYMCIHKKEPLFNAFPIWGALYRPSYIGCYTYRGSLMQGCPPVGGSSYADALYRRTPI